MEITSFTHVDCRRTLFNDVDFSDFIFRGCDLRQAEFRNCDLRKTKFLYCDIRGTNFSTSEMESGSSILTGSVCGNVNAENPDDEEEREKRIVEMLKREEDIFLNECDGDWCIYCKKQLERIDE